MYSCTKNMSSSLEMGPGEKISSRTIFIRLPIGYYLTGAGVVADAAVPSARVAQPSARVAQPSASRANVRFNRVVLVRQWRDKGDGGPNSRSLRLTVPVEHRSYLQGCIQHSSDSLLQFRFLRFQEPQQDAKLVSFHLAAFALESMHSVLETNLRGNRFVASATSPRIVALVWNSLTRLTRPIINAHANIHAVPARLRDAFPSVHRMFWPLFTATDSVAARRTGSDCVPAIGANHVGTLYPNSVQRNIAPGVAEQIAFQHNQHNPLCGFFAACYARRHQFWPSHAAKPVELHLPKICLPAIHRIPVMVGTFNTDRLEADASAASSKNVHGASRRLGSHLRTTAAIKKFPEPTTQCHASESSTEVEERPQTTIGASGRVEIASKRWYGGQSAGGAAEPNAAVGKHHRKFPLIFTQMRNTTKVGVTYKPSCPT
ncbi:hypothetical protein DFH06DRAFT_1291014 [Mycena polygramma]|nr:hypothetical protein DFH06DRAFT_1291014 [Mycena polygramma]